MMLRGAAWAVPPLFFAEKETVMKSFTMFGSHVCPDTIAAMCILDKKGLSYTYKDITGTMIFLKEFFISVTAVKTFRPSRRADM